MNHFRAHFQTTPAPHREWVWRRRHRSRTLATRPRSGRRPAAHASDPRAGRARRSRRAAPREPGASAGRPWASCPSTRDPCFEAVGLGVSEAADLTFGDADFAEGRLDAEQGRRGPQVLARADRARARSPKRRPSAPSSGSLAHPMLLEAMSRLRAIWMRGIRVPCRCRTGASSTGSGRLSLSLISSSFSHLANGLQPQLAGTLAQPALVSHRVGVTSVPGRRRSRRRGR